MVYQSVLGLFVLAALAWAFSEERWRVNLRLVITGLILQVGIATLLLKVPLFKSVFLLFNNCVVVLEEATMAGTAFVFGYLGGGSLPFDETTPGAGYILAFRGLPVVLVMSALSSLFFYWKILPYVVKGFAWCMQKSLGVGGALGVGMAANIFVGMIEAPLCIRPYLKDMTRSELFTVMTCGMATIAGTVMALYANILMDVIPEVVGHLLVASIISAPASIVVSKLIIPETEKETAGRLVPLQSSKSSIDAITKGTIGGITLLINITAMLIVMVAMVYLLNKVLSIFPMIGEKPLSLQIILGYIMAPVVWLMGVPVSEMHTAGGLMGTKTILNEFMAYLELADLPEGALSQRSKLIMIYAMCGFANFGSLGIMIGGLGSMAPERKGEIASLGLKSIVSGTLSTCMTGAVVGFLYV